MKKNEEKEKEERCRKIEKSRYNNIIYIYIYIYKYVMTEELTIYIYEEERKNRIIYNKMRKWHERKLILKSKGRKDIQNIQRRRREHDIYCILKKWKVKYKNAKVFLRESWK